MQGKRKSYECRTRYFVVVDCATKTETHDICRLYAKIYAKYGKANHLCITNMVFKIEID